MKRSRMTMAMLALAAAVGCGGGGTGPDEKTPIPLGKVPAGVLKAAQTTLKGVPFEEASREKIKGQDTYQLRGRDPKTGTMREVKITRGGKVLESN